MLSPPLTPPASDPASGSQSHASSSRKRLPSSSQRVDAAFSVWTGYSDDDSDNGSDNGLRERRKMRRVGGSPRRLKGALLITPTKSPTSPSRFIVRGNVTPSRAAPLFRVTSKPKRVVRRKDKSAIFWPDSDEENDIRMLTCDEGERVLATPAFPSPSKSPARDDKRAALGSLSLNATRHTATTSGRSGEGFERQRPSQFITPSYKAALPRTITMSRSSLLAAMPPTSRAISHLHAVRANVTMGLGLRSALPESIFMQSYWSKLCNTQVPLLDFFTLPSRRIEGMLSQPICSEYANSARSLDDRQPHWLAVGNNEGTLSLLKTPSGRDIDGIEQAEAPSVQTSSSGVFQVNWRYDDELLAVGLNSYAIDIVDTETMSIVTTLTDMRGSCRSLAWSPMSCGSVLASGGRDGAIHLYDLRTGVKSGNTGDAERSPVLSIWSAHTAAATKSRTRSTKNGSPTFRGVTGVAYLPGRGANALCSSSCGDGIVKLWDLRSVAQACTVDLLDDTALDETFSRPMQRIGTFKSDAVVTADAEAEKEVAVSPFDQSLDMTRQSTQNKSSHGISSIAVSSTKIFAASTDGCIYNLPCRDLFQASSSQYDRMANPPLFAQEQFGNSLFAKLALNPDDRTLALGNNKGIITVWDTKFASQAMFELAQHDAAHTKDTHCDSECGTYVGALRDVARPSYLYGHDEKFEVTSVSWAHGYDGYSLASTSDDYTIRTWRQPVKNHDRV